MECAVIIIHTKRLLVRSVNCDSWLRQPYAQALEEWQAQEAARQAAYDKVGSSAVVGRDEGEAAAEAPQFIAYVPLPDTADIEAKVLNKKKADLLAKYTSDALAEKQQEAKDLLNKR